MCDHSEQLDEHVPACTAVAQGLRSLATHGAAGVGLGRGDAECPHSLLLAPWFGLPTPDPPHGSDLGVVDLSTERGHGQAAVGVGALLAVFCSGETLRLAAERRAVQCCPDRL
eukprot:g15022.t1